VVGYHGSFEKDGNIWIVMDLCEAGSVFDLIQICQRTFVEQELKVICASVLLGLKHLHDNRMIHRDIKAGNILLTNAGQAKLADFGVSAQLTTIQSKRATAIGTRKWCRAALGWIWDFVCMYVCVFGCFVVLLTGLDIHSLVDPFIH
jgi:serine/threonine protein kinase